MTLKLKYIGVSSVLVVTLLGGSLANAAIFKDVKEGSWYEEAISWGVQTKIASGYADGTFKPSNSVTEEEFLALLLRSFKDVPQSTTGRWSDPYYDLARANNYPVSSNRNAKITRQAVAEIIAGTQGKNYTSNDAIQYMLGMGLAGGKTSNTIEGYKGKDTLTRAEAVTFIRNVIAKAPSKDLLPRPSTPSPKDELPKLPGNTATPSNGGSVTDTPLPETKKPVVSAHTITLDQFFENYDKVTVGAKDNVIPVNKGKLDEHPSSSQYRYIFNYSGFDQTGAYGIIFFQNPETSKLIQIQSSSTGPKTDSILTAVIGGFIGDAEKAKAIYTKIHSGISEIFDGVEYEITKTDLGSTVLNIFPTIENK